MQRLVNPPRETGSSLIEVMVSILLLSFGILAIGLTMAYAVQMPKLSGYRATAVDLAANYVERMRANPGGLSQYAAVATSYDGTTTQAAAAPVPCAYPTCTSATLVAMDSQQIAYAARVQLPAGGVFVSCDDGTCTNSVANVWIIWQQPDTFAALDSSTGDNCPDSVSQSAVPQPRCLYARFKL